MWLGLGVVSGAVRVGVAVMAPGSSGEALPVGIPGGVVEVAVVVLSVGLLVGGLDVGSVFDIIA